jgi:predicted glycosyltransferase
MKIWIDLDNSPHVPFFLPIVKELQKRGYQHVITARDAFQVRGLLEKSDLDAQIIGKHHGKNKILKLLGLVYRALQLAPTIIKERPVLAISHGSRAQLILASLLKLKSALILDYEHSKHIPLTKPDWKIAPDIIPEEILNFSKNRILRYPGLKEDVYVTDFKPDINLLDDLGIIDKHIIVSVRPPATEAHYHNPESEYIFHMLIEYLGNHQSIHLVILPRNEKQKIYIKSKWQSWLKSKKIIIPNKVIDGLNLIWFSDLVISGGGTMNRESAALGIPTYSIFRGKMGEVDKYLVREGKLKLIENIDDIKKKILVKHRFKEQRDLCCNNHTLLKLVENIEFILNN